VLVFVLARISCPGCVLIGIDQYSCVYVMRTMNTRDPVTEVPPVFLVNMFEYLLTVGFDFSDVLTAVKSGINRHFFLSLTLKLKKTGGFVKGQFWGEFGESHCNQWALCGVVVQKCMTQLSCCLGW